ncbi:hypothetical protein [Microlunatus speluncae]|uniref:hypothetical protein n=1 Tax=Microlunatus speluncae TaxID=2594267 RepID=UPI00126657B0|nr:hypothetical protein [Microlunatus speluncae]
MTQDHQSVALTRRSLIGLAGGLGLAAMTGCGPSGSSTPAQRNAADGVPLPTHVPFTGGKPDLPGDLAAGINDGYFAYPRPEQQTRTVNREVGSGGTTSNLVVTFSPPPAAVGQNAYWQAINAALNTKLTSTLVPTDFATKLAAVLTGDQIPDIVTMYPSEAWGLKRWESVAEAKFADLSPHMSGDAVKEYPNLARLPQESWLPTIVGGKIFATPTLRIRTGSAVFTRSDKIEQLGADPNPASRDEFDEMCAAVTSAKDKRFALGDAGDWLSTLFHPMFGVPNGWRAEPAGGLTYQIETEEWQAAIGYTADTWRKGYWHPSSAGATQFDMEPLFSNGTILVRADNFVRYTVRGKLTFTVDLLRPFLAEGGPAAQHITAATDFLTFIKKADEAKITECLRILDFLSAPFSSQENFLRTYGVEGADHTIDGERPVLTERGEAETTSLSLRFVAGGPDVLFASNGDQTMVRKMHDYQKAVSDHRLDNPVAGVYAESAAKMASVEQKITDTVNDVVVGRKNVSELAGLADTWRKGGGDKLRDEYQAALAVR